MSQPTRTYNYRLGSKSAGLWAIWVHDAADGAVIEHYYAHCDDFGDLVRQVQITPGRLAWLGTNFTDIDDASMLAYYPPEPAPAPAKPAVLVSIEHEDEPGCWIASTVTVLQTAPLDLTEPVYRLLIGGEEAVTASRRELQGLASACAALLGLQLTPIRLRDRRRARNASSACAH